MIVVHLLSIRRFDFRIAAEAFVTTTLTVTLQLPVIDSVFASSVSLKQLFIDLACRISHRHRHRHHHHHCHRFGNLVTVMFRSGVSNFPPCLIRGNQPINKNLVPLRQHHLNAIPPPQRHHLERVLWSLDLLITHALSRSPSLAHAVHRGKGHHRQQEAHDHDRQGLRIVQCSAAQRSAVKSQAQISLAQYNSAV